MWMYLFTWYKGQFYRQKHNHPSNLMPMITENTLLRTQEVNGISLKWMQRQESSKQFLAAPQSRYFWTAAGRLLQAVRLYPVFAFLKLISYDLCPLSANWLQVHLPVAVSAYSITQGYTNHVFKPEQASCLFSPFKKWTNKHRTLKKEKQLVISSSWQSIASYTFISLTAAAKQWKHKVFMKLHEIK